MDVTARALELAAVGLGRTAPNPPVGAVVVRQGVIVGEGHHAGPGRPHAEAVALAAAGNEARDAVLVVTLEPCCHHGRTPPCTDVIVRAGVAEVRYSIRDPDPRVAGRGHDALEASGIRVVAGEGADAARDVMRGYLRRQATGRPWVTAKFAMSLDGKIATRAGDARWISGESSRHHVHELRNRVDGVIVGIGTILADDPRLTVRPAPPDGRQPLRVVVDSRLRLPLDAAVASPALGPGTLVSYVADGSGRVASAEGALLDRGLELLALPSDAAGRVDLEALLDALGRRGLNEVLVEGGSELLAGFFEHRLVDQVEACVAPMAIGGRAAPTPIGGAGVGRIDDAARFETIDVARRGPDVWITARPARPTLVTVDV